MRIAHIADLHLGYRAYHRVTARGGNVREADVANAFNQAIDRLIALEPDIILVAGDIFHVVRPSNAAISDAFRQVSRLRAGLPRVPIVMIAGNHDSPRSNDTGNILTLFREIPGVVVAANGAQQVRIKSLNTSVLCIPHNVLAQDTVVLEPDPSTHHNILMLHGTVGGKVAREKLHYVMEFGGVDIDDTAIRPERWTYVALGHYHLVTELARNMWYSGGIERTSSNIWIETGPKGFLLYDTDAGTCEFHELETRPVIDCPRIDAAGLGANEIDDRIRAAVESVSGGLAGKIVRTVVLNVPRHVLREIDHKKIREYKAEALHFQLELRPPDKARQASRTTPGNAVHRQTLEERIRDFLNNRWQPSSDRIRRERLIELAKQYYEPAQRED